VIVPELLRTGSVLQKGERTGDCGERLKSRKSASCGSVSKSFVWRTSPALPAAEVHVLLAWVGNTRALHAGLVAWRAAIPACRSVSAPARRQAGEGTHTRHTKKASDYPRQDLAVAGVGSLGTTSDWFPRASKESNSPPRWGNPRS